MLKLKLIRAKLRIFLLIMIKIRINNSKLEGHKNVLFKLILILFRENNLELFMRKFIIL
jgi:hypothetical protein